MIKVEFKEIQFLIQNGLEAQLLSCLCIETITIKNVTTIKFSEKYGDYFHVPYSNIKSIKHVKQNEI